MTTIIELPGFPATIDAGTIGNNFSFTIPAATKIAVQLDTAAGAAWGATVVELKLSLDGVNYYTNPYATSTMNAAGLEVFEVTGALYAQLVITTAGTGGTKIIAKVVGINSN